LLRARSGGLLHARARCLRRQPDACTVHGSQQFCCLHAHTGCQDTCFLAVDQMTAKAQGHEAATHTRAHTEANLSPQCTDTLSAHQRHSMRSKGAAALAPILRRGCVAAAAHGQEAPRAPSSCSGSPAPGCAPPPQRPGRQSGRAPAPDPAASARARRPPLRWRPAHRRGARLQCPASHALPAGSRPRGSAHADNAAQVSARSSCVCACAPPGDSAKSHLPVLCAVLATHAMPAG